MHHETDTFTTTYTAIDPLRSGNARRGPRRFLRLAPYRRRELAPAASRKDAPHEYSTPARPPLRRGRNSNCWTRCSLPPGALDPQVILRGFSAARLPVPVRTEGAARSAFPRRPPSRRPRTRHLQLLGRWMIRLGGSDRHRRVRDAFGGLFTARRVGRYRFAIIAERAAAPTRPGSPRGPHGPWSPILALPLPFSVINACSASRSGPGLARRGAGQSWNRGFASQRDTDRSAVQAANDAAQQMLSYFAGLLDQRTAAPADDLMSALASSARRRRGPPRRPGRELHLLHQRRTPDHHRPAHPGHSSAVHPPRGAGRPAGRSRALARRRGGNAAAGITPTTFTGVTPRTDADIDGVTCPGRAAAPAVPGRRQPRPVRLRRPRPVRHQPRPQPASQLLRRRTLLPGRPHRQDARRSRAEHPVHPAGWAGRLYPARHYRQRPHAPDRPLHRHLAAQRPRRERWMRDAGQGDAARL